MVFPQRILVRQPGGGPDAISETVITGPPCRREPGGEAPSDERVGRSGHRCPARLRRSGLRAGPARSARSLRGGGLGLAAAIGLIVGEVWEQERFADLRSQPGRRPARLDPRRDGARRDRGHLRPQPGGLCDRGVRRAAAPASGPGGRRDQLPARPALRRDRRRLAARRVADRPRARGGGADGELAPGRRIARVAVAVHRARGRADGLRPRGRLVGGPEERDRDRVLLPDALRRAARPVARHALAPQARRPGHGLVRRGLPGVRGDRALAVPHPRPAVEQGPPGRESAASLLPGQLRLPRPQRPRALSGRSRSSPLGPGSPGTVRSARRSPAHSWPPSSWPPSRSRSPRRASPR